MHPNDTPVCHPPPGTDIGGFASPHTGIDCPHIEIGGSAGPPTYADTDGFAGPHIGVGNGGSDADGPTGPHTGPGTLVALLPYTLMLMLVALQVHTRIIMLMLVALQVHPLVLVNTCGFASAHVHTDADTSGPAGPPTKSMMIPVALQAHPLMLMRVALLAHPLMLIPVARCPHTLNHCMGLVLVALQAHSLMLILVALQAHGLMATHWC